MKAYGSRILLTLALTIGSLWAFLGPIISKKPNEGVQLGLDLKGGVSYELEIDLEGLSGEDAADAVDRAVEIIQNRVNQTGVVEPEIFPVGRNRIEVRIPAVNQQRRETFRSLILSTAYLEFKLVHPQSASLVPRREDPDFIPPPGYELKELVIEEPGQAPRTQYLYVRQRAELTGSALDRAVVAYDNFNRPYVALEFNSDGARVFEDVTGAHVGERLAIVLDGALRSAPDIREKIEGGRAQITGDFTRQEATELAIVLKSGSLPTKVAIAEERSVDPTLGRASIRSGVMAGVAGMIVVMVFMIVYYRFSGLVADIALLLDVVLMLGGLALLKAVLTLPGIAGFILTIGMAVDANVLIYERMREELRTGKSLAAAVEAAYHKVFWTIFDSNITTLLTAAILWFKATGPVRGFAVTLTIGLLVSMFTALVVTRLIFDILVSSGRLKKVSMLQIMENSRIDFVGKRRIAYLGTSILVLLSIGVVLYRGPNALGVDFTGGEAIRLAFTQRVPSDQLEALASQSGMLGVRATYHGEPDPFLEIRAKGGSVESFEKVLAEKYPDAGFQRLSIDTVGSTVGKELKTQALVAMGWSLVGMLIYISMRFEFRFAVGAVLALFHDVIVTTGVFVMTGREISLPVVAALLTIVGYSVNDTIVIYDRIRENMGAVLQRMSFYDLLNTSLNQTLSRTLLTSLTVIFVVLCLVLFGGGVINDFALTMLIGLISGVYSTIYIATPVLLAMHKKE